MTHLLHPRDPPSTAAGRLPMLQPGALSIVVKKVQHFASRQKSFEVHFHELSCNCCVCCSCPSMVFP